MSLNVLEKRVRFYFFYKSQLTLELNTYRNKSEVLKVVCYRSVVLTSESEHMRVGELGLLNP